VLKLKGLAIAFIMALLFSTIAVAVHFGTAQAETTIPNPSVPEFTLKYVDTSYDVPATYSTDPYTGKEVLVEPAHRVNNGTIELWITNQQYAYSNGSTFHVFYLVQTKGHYEEKWVFATPTFESHLLSSDSDEYGVFIEDTPHQSDSEYTVLSFSAVYPPHYPYYTNWTYQYGSQVDFRCKQLLVMNPNILFLTIGRNFTHLIVDIMKQALFLI
jgi:hypothetical protein